MDSDNISNSYVQLISPEISINADATKNLIGNDSYFDSLCGLASIIQTNVIYDNVRLPSIGARAKQYLKYDGTYVYTATTNNRNSGAMIPVSTFSSDID